MLGPAPDHGRQLRPARPCARRRRPQRVPSALGLRPGPLPGISSTPNSNGLHRWQSASSSKVTTNRWASRGTIPRGFGLASGGGAYVGRDARPGPHSLASTAALLVDRGRPLAQASSSWMSCIQALCSRSRATRARAAFALRRRRTRGRRARRSPARSERRRDPLGAPRWSAEVEFLAVATAPVVDSTPSRSDPRSPCCGRTDFTLGGRSHGFSRPAMNKGLESACPRDLPPGFQFGA